MNSLKKKKLDPNQLWKHMEEPLYFQEDGLYNFSKRIPLIGKIAKDGGLILLNHYLKFKYRSFLSPHLLQQQTLFTFKIPPVKMYISKGKWPVAASAEEKHWIVNQYYGGFDITYELIGDIFQEKAPDILQKLVQCQYDFNHSSVIERLSQYLYVNRDELFLIHDEVLDFLLAHGLKPENYIDMMLNNLWDMFSLPVLAKASTGLIPAISYLLDHGATLSHFSPSYLNKLLNMLEDHYKKLSLPAQKQPVRLLLEDIAYLQGQILEYTTSFVNAKSCYTKAGSKGEAKIKAAVSDIMERLANPQPSSN